MAFRFLLRDGRDEISEILIPKNPKYRGIRRRNLVAEFLEIVASRLGVGRRRKDGGEEGCRIGKAGRESDYRVVPRASNQRRKRWNVLVVVREMQDRKDRWEPGGGISNDRSKVLPRSSARFVVKSIRSYRFSPTFRSYRFRRAGTREKQSINLSAPTPASIVPPSLRLRTCEGTRCILRRGWYTCSA